MTHGDDTLSMPCQD